MNRLDLIREVKQGRSFEYLFFYKTSEKHGYLSQWWSKHPFWIDKVCYRTAEHYMMAEKARMFSDQLSEAKILNSYHPSIAKSLGRKVKNFNKDAWMKFAFDIVWKGNMAKFSQNPPLKRMLLHTGSKILVEASPTDDVWGIKMDDMNPDAENPEKWQGENLLGFVLMEVRKDLG